MWGSGQPPGHFKSGQLRPGFVDELDAAILREMFRGRMFLWGGGDPRLGTTELASRLGVDRTTVWSRLKAWKEERFLIRQEIVPNPSLFGAGVAGGDIRVDDPRRKSQVLDALQLVDGVLSGLDQVGPYVLLLYALESETALNRCTRLIRQLPNVDEVSTCIPFEPPRSELEPTASDWRILRAFRKSPDRPFAIVAKEAGVGARTLTRRYGELLNANAIWSFPVLDFSHYRGAVMARFVVVLSGPGETPSLINACQRGLRQMVWSEAVADASPTMAADAPWVDVYCHLTSAGEVEEVHRWLLGLPFVKAVEVYFPRSWFVVTSWFDERIQHRIAVTGNRRPR